MTLLIPLMAVTLAGGIALGLNLRIPPSWCLLAAGCGALAALLWRRRTVPWLAAWLGAALLAGAGLGASAAAPPLERCRPMHHTGRRSVRLVARVLEPGAPARSGERALLQAGLLLGHGRTVPLCGQVELLRTDTPWPLRPGERILVRGRLRPITGGRNPGSTSAILRSVGGAPRARMAAAGGDIVLLSRRPEGVAQGARRALRRTLGAAVADPARRAILAALILGDRSGISDQQRRDFSRSGASHLLAISGLHLALVALGVMGLCRRALLLWPPLARGGLAPERAAVLPGVAAALGYTVLTGASAPTVRACVLVLGLALARLAHRPPDLWRPLSLAAVGLLLVDPANLLRPGFQLSFVAVAGIAVVARRFSLAPADGWWIAALLWLRGLALASAAATAATLPLVAQHFSLVTLAGLLVNLAAIPLTTLLLLPAALSGAALAGPWPWAGTALLGLAAWAAGLLDALCARAAALPLHAHVPAPGWPAALLLTGAALALLLGTWARRAALGAMAVLLLAALLSRAAAPSPRPLELIFLDVGQGDSTFVALPDGGAVLVDGGGDPEGKTAPGRTRVLPFLRARGVRRLDLVVATHPHPDHTAGLEAVLDELPVAELWLCWHGEPNPWHRRLLAVAHRRGIQVTAPRVLRRGEVVLRPLWPEGYDGQCADPGRGANDNSVVLRLEYGQAAALLPGDIEHDAEQALIRRHGPLLRADLLKAPHHGSGTSSSPDFLDAVAPRLALISCGLDNAFGIPPARVVARYRSRGVLLGRVDRRGAIGVRLRSDGGLRWRALLESDSWQPVQNKGLTSGR